MYEIIKRQTNVTAQSCDKFAQTLTQLNKILMALMAIGFVGGARFGNDTISLVAKHTQNR